MQKIAYICNREMSSNRIISERNAALREVHKRIIKASGGIGNVSRGAIVSLIGEQSAPRFYISPFTARLYITQRYKCSEENSPKQAMVSDLVETYRRLIVTYPNAPKEWLYEKVVEQPAKSFYLSAHRIEEIIFNYSGRNGK